MRPPMARQNTTSPPPLRESTWPRRSMRHGPRGALLVAGMVRQRPLVADIVEKVCDLASFRLGQLRFGNFGWWPCGRKGGVTRPAFPERYWSVSSGRGASDSVRLRRGGTRLLPHSDPLGASARGEGLA